jgi:signal transduction histidine kinase
MEASKIERKRRELNLDAVDISNVITNVTHPIIPIIEQREIKLDTLVEENLPPVKANQKQLEHVMRNLLSNAIKFNKKGGKISVQARRRVDAVEIAVADTGVGIEKDNISKVFDKFFQEDTSTDRTYGGTGLGLAVAKEIIEAHSGRIKVESEPGKGSRFYFRLQFAKEE